MKGIKQDEMKVPGFIREDLSEVVKYVQRLSNKKKPPISIFGDGTLPGEGTESAKAQRMSLVCHRRKK